MSIAKALLAFQADAPPVHLDATNPHFKNRYASLGGVVAAVRPALNKHGLVYTQLPTNLDGTPALRTVLMHADSGEVLEDTMPLILSKQDSQAQGSALTYGRRYALLSILGLVGDEDDDANSAAVGTAVGGAVRNAEASRDPAPTHSEADAHGLQSSRADHVGATPGDASDKQKAMIRRLAKKLGLDAGAVDSLSKRDASAKIEELLAVEAGTSEAVAVGGSEFDDSTIPF